MAELQQYLLNIDHTLLHLINSTWSFSLGDSFFPFITDLYKQFYFQAIVYPVLLILYYLRFKKRGVVLFFSLVMLLAFNDLVGGKFVKKHFQRPRPFQNETFAQSTDPADHVQQRSPAGGFSFYSNHASNMTAFATFTTMSFPPLGFVAIPAALLVSYSRVYNGVHYPSDVCAGALMGFLLAFLFIQILRYYGIADAAPHRRKNRESKT